MTAESVDIQVGTAFYLSLESYVANGGAILENMSDKPRTFEAALIKPDTMN